MIVHSRILIHVMYNEFVRKCRGAGRIGCVRARLVSARTARVRPRRTRGPRACTEPSCSIQRYATRAVDGWRGGSANRYCAQRASPGHTAVVARRAAGIDFRTCKDQVILGLDRVRSPDRAPYKLFTPYALDQASKRTGARLRHGRRGHWTRSTAAACSVVGASIFTVSCSRRLPIAYRIANFWDFDVS